MADLQQLAKDWIAAWNGRDLERILSLYAEDCEMTSPKIVVFGRSETGSLRGKAALRDYWTEGLARAPDLRFEHKKTYTSPNSVVIRYTDPHGHDICEYLRCDANGKIVNATAHHLPDGE